MTEKVVSHDQGLELLLLITERKAGKKHAKLLKDLMELADAKKAPRGSYFIDTEAQELHFHPPCYKEVGGRMVRADDIRQTLSYEGLGIVVEAFLPN